MPSIESRIVRLKDLEGVLPPGVARVTPSELEEQIRKRQDSCERRFAFDRR